LLAFSLRLNWRKHAGRVLNWLLRRQSVVRFLQRCRDVPQSLRDVGFFGVRSWLSGNPGFRVRQAGEVAVSVQQLGSLGGFHLRNKKSRGIQPSELNDAACGRSGFWPGKLYLVRFSTWAMARTGQRP
jgi:hypothetical protein